MFSLSWFTTIPGLLITGGVLLLVVALIIFIVTSKKDKNKKDANADTNASSGKVNSSIPTVQVMDSQGGVSTTTVTPVDSSAVQPNVVSVTPQPTTVVETPQVNVEMPISSSVSVPEVGSNEDFAKSANLNQIPEPVVNPVVDTTPAVEVPTTPSTDAFTNIPQVPNIDITGVPNSDVAAVSQPPVEEAVSIPNIPTVVEPVQDSMSVVNATVPAVEINTPAPSIEQVVPEMQDVGAPTITVSNPSSYNDISLDSASIPSMPEQNTVPIYGGSAPVVPDIPAPEAHPIYGGANPLENTQSVPISNITSGVYNANNNVVSVQPEVSVSTDATMPVVEEVPTVTYPNMEQQTTPIPVVGPDINSNPVPNQNPYVAEQNTSLNPTYPYQSTVVNNSTTNNGNI